MPTPAAILLAFANDWVDNKRHLRSLLDESKAIDKALAPLVEAGVLVLPPPIHNATIDDVIGTFRERTAAEQALWDEARTLRSGDGLRAYLRAYPAGAYADEARSRLAGCTTERVETLGPDRAVRYAWTVNPNRARPLPTTDEARSDALTRGNQDAATTCKALAMKAQLLSALAEPHDWKCTELDRGFACGFDGEIVCHVRDRIESDRERCHDENE